MSAPRPSVVCTGVDFSWPDGTPVFTDFSATFPAGRSGLVGVNGCGKSTLLRLIEGRLRPAAGTIAVAGELGHVAQDVAYAAEVRVDEALGIAGIRAGLRAIEAGAVDDEHFAAVGDDWDVDERARATLDQLGFAGVELERRVGRLSGGESVLLGLAAQFLRRPAVLLLDEPTNNLDRVAREHLYGAVRTWPGALVVVSHDRELLGLVDQIGDLRDGELRWYGGGWSDYEAAVAAEQQTARRRVRVAENDLKRQERDLAEARVKLDRRARYGQKMADTKHAPKIVMGNRVRQAEVSAGKHRTMHRERVDAAQERLTRSEDAVRDDPELRIHLPATEVPNGRTVLVLERLRTRSQDAADLEIRGPERIALIGRNGAGKTTLLDTVAGRLAPVAGAVRVGVPMRYLPQRLDVLDPALTVLGNLTRFAPTASDNEIRAGLARFLFRGRRADQLAGTLSGGERFRAALAALLLAEPAPQLLLLDEPTNNLDLASARELTAALAAYRGALVVASHDEPFLRSVAPTRWIEIDGVLRDVAAR